MLQESEMAENEPKKSAANPVEQEDLEKTFVGEMSADGAAVSSKRKYSPPYLVVVDGPRVGSRFPLHHESPNVLGRAVGVTVRLEDQSVSRQHTEVLKSATGWTAKDLSSKNGTKVNGRIISEPVVLGHKDLLKVGIYLLRLVTQEIAVEEEMTLPPEYLNVDSTVFAQADPEVLTGSLQATPASEDESEASEPADEEVFAEQAAPTKKRQIILVSLLLIALLAAGIFVGKRLFFTAEKTPAAKTAPKDKVSPVAAKKSGLPAATPADNTAKPKEASAPPVVKAPTKIPVFLDFVSSPLPAIVSFQGKELGKTPLRVNVELEPNRNFTTTARFSMPEVNEEYIQEHEFKLDPEKAVIPILFRGPIGMIRVDDLPRDVQFYLEGNFSYDRFKQRSAKLNEIILQKPIYVPYGRYVVELRRARKLGETSQTFVQDIIYRREFNLGAENTIYTMAIADNDLEVFPVEVRSVPPNADVFIDGKKVGKTPFEGSFPTGEHRMSIRKEGFFEHSEDLKVDINTPYATEVKLRTSIAGAHLNNAQAALNRGMYQDAINELAEVLNSKPSPSEEAQVNYLLGKAYLKLGEIPRAIGYFEKAKTSEEQKYWAMLGIVNAYAIQKKTQTGLPLLVEVMLKAEDENLKREASNLFQKISPFRSVLYVYSDPQGAKVTVNGKAVAQATPVILHDLPLGNYRVRVEKAGYLPTDLNLNLSVNEFNPIIVKLNPIPK